MYSDAKKYFKYLDLVREDIREEFELLEIQAAGKRICDFGCGSGITTFGLALEADDSECIGIDLFCEGTDTSPAVLNQYVEVVEHECQYKQSLESKFPDSLCKLIRKKRAPRFIQGDIVLDKNLPQEIDLAYIKKVLINIRDKKYGDAPSGKEALLRGLRHMPQGIKLGGWMIVVEYDKNFELENYFEKCDLKIMNRAQIKRREIRSKGRTNAISIFTQYLVRKSV
jgi:SAM-dependent methyltransferase